MSFTSKFVAFRGAFNRNETIRQRHSHVKPLLDARYKVECKWPGDPAERGMHMRVCGEPVKAGKPYCPAHCEIAYEPNVRKVEGAGGPKMKRQRERETV